ARQRQDAAEFRHHFHAEKKPDEASAGNQSIRFDQRPGLEKIKWGQERETNGAHAQLQFPIGQKERRERHADQISRQHVLALPQIGKTAQRKQHKENELYFRLAGATAEPAEHGANDERQNSDCRYRGEREQQQKHIVIGEHQSQRQDRADIINEPDCENDFAQFGLVVSG